MPESNPDFTAHQTFEESVEELVDKIVTHAFHHPPVPKDAYRKRIMAAHLAHVGREKRELLESLKAEYASKSWGHYDPFKAIDQLIEEVDSENTTQ